MRTELELVNICVLNVGYTVTHQRLGGRDLSSPFARLYYLKAGHAMIHLPDLHIEAKPGFMYLIPPFVPHSYLCEAGCEFYYMFVYERYGEQTDIFDIYHFPYEVQANHATDLLFENYCNFYPELNFPYQSEEDFYTHPTYLDYVARYAQMNRFEKMQLQGFVWIVASFFMKHAQKRLDRVDERLLMTMQYIKANIQHEISLDHLADIACTTKSHLGRLFREKLGTTPLQYTIRTRIKCAQRLLMTTHYSIAYIASQVGYDDVSYFIRVFKRTIGFTPQDYRNKMKY